MTIEIVKHEYKLTKEKAKKLLNLKGEVQSLQLYTPQDLSTGRNDYTLQYITIHTTEEVEV